jgi:hypothetical protein
MDEDEAVVSLAAPIVLVRDGCEVGDVLGDECALLALREREEVEIGERSQLGTLGHRLGVVAAGAQLHRNRQRVHLVDEELQVSAACARCAAAS